ncbi:MAG: GNAT family N-acetyltransferase [Actinomycetes bacterium]
MQKAAYAVEAAIIGDDGIPPLHESLDELQAAGLAWRAVLDAAGTPLGAVAVGSDHRVVDIDRLVVDPAHARRGLGARLVESVLLDAAGSGREVTASTARDNLPARRLYESFGFRHTVDVEPEPGLWVSAYRWRQRPATRVVCLDAAGAVLLLSWRDPVDGRLLHEPPGGGLEAGEDAHQAAVRELAEETGLPGSYLTGRVVPVPRSYRWNGRRHVGVEPFHLACAPDVAPPVSPTGLTDVEQRAYLGHRWVTPSALESLDGSLEPPVLADVVRQLTR